MAQAALIVSAVASVGAGVMQHEQAQAANRAQAKQARIERRIAAIENARQARRAVAARRVQQADIQAGAVNSGTGVENSSAVRGAVGSLTTQTAVNIGAATTRAAASFAQQKAAIMGARQSARYGTLANIFTGISDIASGVMTFDLAKKAPTNTPDK